MKRVLVLSLVLGFCGCGDAARVSILREQHVDHLDELNALKKEDFPMSYRSEFEDLKRREHALVKEKSTPPEKLQETRFDIQHLEEKNEQRRPEWDVFVASIEPRDRIFHCLTYVGLWRYPSEFYAIVTLGKKPRYYWVQRRPLRGHF